MTDRALALKVDDLDTMTLGKVLAQSGYFQDARDAAQCIVKVLAGRELGLGPVASMTGVYIVKGRPALSANLLGGVLKRSGRYNYRVKELTDKAAEIVFMERNGAAWETIGTSRFTVEDARRAGTQNMEKFARNMLFARAMTNGIRWYAPDVFAGGVYTPEELGAPVDGDGAPVAAIITQNQPDPDQDVPTPAAAQPHLSAAEPEQTPGPQPATPGQKIARIAGNIPGWQAACKEFANRFPAYQTALKGGQPSGFPNHMHILGAALAEGFAEVTPDNYEDVITAITARANGKQAEPA